MSQAASTAYDTALFDDNFPPGVERHYWFKARNRIVSDALRGAQRRGLLPHRPKILEVGCGTGIVVSALHARGHDVRGVEIGRPALLSDVRDRIDTGVSAQSLPAAVRADYDALLVLDVIEHVPDDVAFLRDTVAAFPKCRLVLITVPARPEVWSSHDTHYGHYRRYLPATLRSSLEGADLAPDRIRYMFRGLYSAAALMKAAGRDRDPVLRPPGRPALHGLLAAGLLLEDAILRSSPVPGLSLMATARVRSAPA